MISNDERLSRIKTHMLSASYIGHVVQVQVEKLGEEPELCKQTPHSFGRDVKHKLDIVAGSN